MTLGPFLSQPIPMSRSLTLSQIAELVGGEIRRGEGSEAFTGLNALKDAAPTDVSFCGNAKYLRDFQNSDAGVVLVGRDADISNTRMAIIAVDNPTWAFSYIVDHFIDRAARPDAGISPAATVDATAEVDETASVLPGAVISAGAKVGARTIIGAKTFVGPMVHIGDDCELKSGIAIEERCVLGNRITIQSGAVIGSDGFGYEFVDGALKKIDQIGIVQIDDDVDIGANVTIDRARFGKTHIGRGTKIDNLVQIGHNVVIGQNSILVAQSGVAGSTTLGNFVTIAAQAGVAGHIQIGDQVQLAARAGALKNISQPGAYSGLPARPLQQELRNKARVQRLKRLYERVARLEKELSESE